MDREYLGMIALLVLGFFFGFILGKISEYKKHGR